MQKRRTPVKTGEGRRRDRLLLNRTLREAGEGRKEEEGEGDGDGLDTLAILDDVALFKEARRLQHKRSLDCSPKEKEKEKRIRWVQMGNQLLPAWYLSPYPDSLAHEHKVNVCQFCLKCLISPTVLSRHAAKCPWRHPPGNEIYRDDGVSFWEVDGKLAKVYCQNLCLLAKLFLEHKTLFYDVEPFLFYVMTETSSTGCQMVGYFSKEKKSLMNCNLSCLLTLPSYQRKGYGRLLIDFSYLLSRMEDKIGSPEHPLSDMGLLTYRKYWRDVIFEYLAKMKSGDSFSIKDLSVESGIHPNDIVSTLQYMNMIRYYKGKHIVVMTEVEKNQNGVQRPSSIRRILPDSLRWKPNSFRDAVEVG